MQNDMGIPVKLVGEVDGIIYEFLPLREAAHNNNYSESYVRYLADTGEIIATKYLNRWYVEQHLSRLQREPPVQDTS